MVWHSRPPISCCHMTLRVLLLPPGPRYLFPSDTGLLASAHTISVFPRLALHRHFSSTWKAFKPTSTLKKSIHHTWEEGGWVWGQTGQHSHSCEGPGKVLLSSVKCNLRDASRHQFAILFIYSRRGLISTNCIVFHARKASRRLLWRPMA